MKIAFSTLGCPDFTWEDICVMAKDLRFNGIELRGVGSEISSYRSKPFRDNEITSTVERLRNLEITVPCISSSCCIKDEKHINATLNEGYNSIDLAVKLGSGFVRVLADVEPHETSVPDESAVIERLRELISYSDGKNVTILIETNGYYARSVRLRKLLQHFGPDEVGVLWDIHHPFRYFGEQPEETIKNIGEWVRYVHIKDSVKDDTGKIRYKMLGDGDVPVDEALKLLKDMGYEGFVSLEWVKRWSNDLEDAYIVFPQFANYMKRYLPDNTKEDEGDVYTIKKYPYERDKLIDVTLADLIDIMADSYPEREAFIFPQNSIRYTYSEFREVVDRYARAFHSIGIRKGDHVAIWATNCPEWIITLFACGRIGAVLVTVNTAYKIHEAEYLLRQSDSGTLVLMDGYKDSDYLKILSTICPELRDCSPGCLNSDRLPKLKNVITIGTPLEGAFEWSNLESEADLTDQSVIDDIVSSLDTHEVVNMQYTSGTTGFPKGVMLTHYNIINNGKTIGDCMKFTTDDRLLICVPLFHCFGLVLAVMASFTHASAMVVLDYFRPSAVLESIEKEKCTAIHGVPTMFIACLENKGFSEYDLSSLRTGIMAGSPCPVKVMQDVASKMNMSEITIVYGQTEASPGCTQTRTHDSLEKRVSTVGKALPGVECRIVDPETGEEVAAGIPGEFLARGYNVMKGYYNMPEATASAIDKEGWLHTGDLAVVDSDGYYKITGRIKDMIIRGGENIYPKEIEDFLYTHPAIRDVQVVGVPDKVYGEEILAAVILKEGAELSEDQVKSYVKENMAKHKTPRYVIFVSEFPMTASGKIQKFKLREMASAKLGVIDSDE